MPLYRTKAEIYLISDQRVDKPIDTLADIEKGREIWSMQARRRTMVR